MVERILLASRWLLAPLYLGLAVVLLTVVVEFFLELAHLARAAIGGDAHVTFSALALLDLVLVASLIVMVMLSGFENFVAKITLGEAQERLSWLTKLDTGSLKVKIMGSIVIISAIDLLEQFFAVEQVPSEKLMWLLAIHLTFVLTAVLLALVDRLSAH
ncbi:MAG TPA: TIGR00645 family protein [Stellaceae bacterium]|nr:TIGR00645 family protein [Stellaceae bacterium]